MGSDKKELLFAATLQLVAERGFHGTSMAKVAKTAGVSAGIIYHYFKNKDDLLLELYRECKFRIIGPAEKVLDDSLTLTEQVKKICACLVYSHLRNFQEVQYIQQFSASPYNTIELCDEIYQDFIGVIEVMIEARKKKVLRDLPDMVYASLFADFAGCLGQRHWRGEFEMDARLEEEIIDMIWQAIRYRD